MSNLRRINKDEALIKYKKKWGLDKYRFFCYGTGTSECIEVYSIAFGDGHIHRWMNEIKALDTLVTRLNRSQRIILVNGTEMRTYPQKNFIEFDSFNAFKEYVLIEKLGITNYV